jgi:putative transposase
LLKSGLNQSITDVAELWQVHRITVQRWFKQYSEGGLSSLLKLGQSTGRPRAISSEIIAGISTKINEDSCEFKSYKEIARWVEKNYQVSVKYQTLHKQIRYRMKAKLKVPRRLSNKKDPGVASELKKTRKIPASSVLVGFGRSKSSKKGSQILVSYYFFKDVIEIKNVKSQTIR